MQFNIAHGFNLPPFWTTETQQAYYKSRLIRNQAKYVCPLMMRLTDADSWYKFPVDPVISLSGNNSIIKKNISKINAADSFRGSVKELFSHSDYDITFAGVLAGELESEFPQTDLCNILDLCTASQTVQVACDFLNYFGIIKVAIESYDFPFTKGKNNQQFTIKAVSDMFDYDSLFINN